MDSELVLYEADSDEEEDIIVELSAGYDVILSDMEDKLGSSVEPQLMRVIESLIHQSIQGMSRSDDSEIHKAYAQLILSLQETEEVDLDSLVENSIHSLKQQVEQQQSRNNPQDGRTQ